MEPLRTCFLALLLTFAGCTTTYRLSPIAEYTQPSEIIYLSGQELILSSDSAFAVGLYGGRDDGPLVLHVVYLNSSDSNITVDPEAIQVAAVGVSTAGVASTEYLRVYAADDYLRRLRNRQTTALVLQAIAGGMEAASAGTSTSRTYGTYQGSSGGGYSYSGSYSGTTTTTDRSAQIAARQRNQAAIATQAEQFRQSSAVLSDGLLRKTTLFPRSYVHGNVMVDHALADHYIVQIEYAGRIWSFKFKPLLK